MSISPSLVMAQPPSLLQQGIKALEEERIDEALGLFKQAVQEDPQSAQAHLYLGRVLHQSRQFAAAEEAFNKSLELDPDNSEARLRLGILYEDTGRLSEAETTYQTVVKRAAGARLGDIAQRRLTQLEIRLHFEKARGLSREGKFREALTELERVVELDPQDAEAYFGMGEIYRLQQDWGQAFRAYQKVVDIRPGHAGAYVRIGQYYETQREWEKAREAFEKVIAVRKDGPEAQEAVRHLEALKRQIKIMELIKAIHDLVEKHEMEPALQRIEELLALDPKNLMGYYFRGYIAEIQRRYDAAVQDLSRAIELDPTYLPAKVELGTIYTLKGSVDKSISLYRDVIARGRPDDVVVKRAQSALTTIERIEAGKATMKEAKTSLEQGDVSAAEKSLEEDIQLHPKNVQSYFALAGVYIKGGDMDKALAIVRRGVENNPKSPRAHLQLGLFLEQRDQLEEARHELETVISLIEDSPDAMEAKEHLKSVETKLHFRESKREMAKGDYESALQEIQLVIAAFPNDPSAYMSQGMIYDRLNRTEDAVSALRKAIELNPKYVEAHIELALVLEGKGRFEEARSEYETVLSLNPDEKRRAQIQSRLEELEKWAKLNQQSRIVRELYDKGKFQESLKETETLIALNPSNYVAYLFRGMAYVELKLPIDAIDAFRKAVELQPKAFMARLQLGRVYMDEGRYEEAREEFERVVREGVGRREADFASTALQRLRTLSYNLSYTQSLNSNITQRAAATTETSSSLTVGLNYILARSKQGRLLATGSASQNIYYKSQGIGNGLSGSLSGYYQIGNWGSLSGGLNLGYGFFDRKMTSVSRSASMAAAINTGGIPTGLTFSYSFSPARGLRSSISDTDNHSLSVAGSQRLTAKDQVNMSYSFRSSINLDMSGNNLAYRSNGMSMGYNRQITKDLSGSLGLNLTYYAYMNPDSTTLFQRFRRTFQNTLSGGLSTQLSELVRLSLNYSYTDSVTNIKVSTQELLKLNDILASPIPIVGGDFQSHSVSINYSVSF